jgi:outer membrane lipoprotein-sorting protein
MSCFKKIGNGSKGHDMNRRDFILATPALLLPSAGFAQAPTLSAADRASAIRTVGQAVNAVTRLQGRFAQTNPNGSNSTGRFWLQRPGKVRFEYDAPSPLVLLSDGTNVALQDTRLKTTDRYPLRQTPLYFLLKANVDLERDVVVSNVVRDQGNILVSMRDRRREADGELTVVFDERTRGLEQWSIRDRQGRNTRVRLIDPVSGGAINPALFTAPGGNRRYKPGD